MRAQLVEQRVVLVVGDDRVVEDVVAATVLGELLAQLRGARGGLLRRRSLHLAGGRGEQPRQVVAVRASMPATSVRSKCTGVTAMRPAWTAARSVPALVVEAGVGAVDPVAPAAVLVLGVELELVAVDALAQARDLRRPSGSPAGTLMFSSVPAGSGTSSSSADRRARRSRRRARRRSGCRGGSPSRARWTAGRRRCPGCPRTSASSAAATVPE